LSAFFLSSIPFHLYSHQYLTTRGVLILTKDFNRDKRNILSFDEYYTLVQKNPLITQTSTQRIFQMIDSYGKTTKEDGTIEYNFFKGKIFGSDKQIERIMSYFKGASLGLDIKKRVLLLLGPPGGGKSLFLNYIKKGLSDYTHTADGAVYRIVGCPINEEPLHLIEQQSERDLIWENKKIKIEGKLCPVCKFRFVEEWKNNLKNAEIERFFIDEEVRTGIGTFAPSESNDMAELYGSPNKKKLQDWGSESDPRTFDFSGELHKANRGIMEFIEVLKANPNFLHILLTLAEEQQFKSPRFPLQYVDEALIAHTNEGEFLRFIQNKENEAIVDRLFIVNMPYNLEPTNEELIYHSALKTKLVVKGVSIHPGALRFASEFVCLTRLSEVRKRIYEDDPIVKSSVNSYYRDGMEGISPRFVLNALAIALVESPVEIVTVKGFCQTFINLIKEYPVLSDVERKFYLGLIKTLMNKNIEAYESITFEDVDLQKLKQRNKNSFFNN
jgi:serine protein kinase